MTNDLDRISFAEWLIALNTQATKAGYKTDRSLTELTGPLFWYSYYEEGLTPDAALDAMEKDGVEFIEEL